MSEIKQILFESFPKQEEFLQSVFSDKYNFILYGGAIRGGKTFAGLSALLLLCKKYPGSKWAVVRNTLQTLKINTIPSFHKICPKRFIKHYSQDTQTITFQNNSKLIFMGENYSEDKELNRFKGLEVNGFLLEEINELQEKTFNKCLERAGSHITINQPRPIILATCNPANNWVKEKFYDEYKRNSLPHNWLYIPSKITDNPFIPPEYLESLKSMPRYEYEVFVNGNWEYQSKSGNEFYKEFSMEKHVKNVMYKKELPIWLSIDENVNPYFSCAVWQIEGKVARQIDELAMRNPNNTVVGMANEIKRKYGSHKAGFIITGDATSNKQDVKIEKGYNLYRLIVNELRTLNPVLRVPASNPSVFVRGLFINTLFYSNFNGIRIEIDVNCKETIKDLIHLQQSADGTKLKTKTTDKTGARYEEYGHFSDTMDYLITSAFASDYLNYQKGTSGITFSLGKNNVSKHGY